MHATHHARTPDILLFLDACLQAHQALLLDLVRRAVGQIGGRRAGARAVQKTVPTVEVHVVDEPHGRFEIGVGLARKADDEIGRERDVGPNLAQPADDGFVFQRRVAALHGGEHAVGARLHGQVDLAHQFRGRAIGVDEALGEFQWVRGGVAQAFDAGNFRHVGKQQREVGFVAIDHAAPVGIHVLAQQSHFPDALVGQVRYLGNHVVEGSAEFLAARVGHDTEAAILAATFHDRDEGCDAFDFRRRQMIELLDFGKGDIDLRLACGLSRRYQLGQAVQGLRAEYQVHVGRPLDDGRTLLAGHAAADADD